MIEAEIQTHPTPFAELKRTTTRFNPWRRLYFISEMALEISHETPDWCNYMRTARNSPNNGRFHVVCSQPDLKTRDLQSRNWDFRLFSQLWSSLLILLLKLDTPSSYTQKEISHEHVLQTRFRILKNNEYFVSSRPAGSCSGLNRQPILPRSNKKNKNKKTASLSCRAPA
jgi:hypothetical protein